MNTTKVVGFPRLYRFHDRVAVNPPRGSGGQTFYLSREEAAALGSWLVRAAEDIKTRRFVDSMLPEFGISDQASGLPV